MLWWRGLLATGAWPRASGKELGQAPGEVGWSCSYPRDFTPGALDRKSPYFFQTPSLHPAPPPAWPRVWGHAEEQPEGLSQELLGWLWPRLFLQERRTRGPFCVWELIAKSHLGCHSSPDQLPEECKGERGREKERVVGWGGGQGEARGRDVKGRASGSAGNRSPPWWVGPRPQDGSPAFLHRCVPVPTQDRARSCEPLSKGLPLLSSPFPRMAVPSTPMCDCFPRGLEPSPGCGPVGAG